MPDITVNVHLGGCHELSPVALPHCRTAQISNQRHTSQEVLHAQVQTLQTNIKNRKTQSLTTFGACKECDQADKTLQGLQSSNGAKVP